MKKKVLIVLSVIVVLLFAVGSAYLIDKNRMANNKPVIFSTWGCQYVPPEERSNQVESSSGETEGSSTSAYVPDGMDVATSDDVGTKTEDVIQYNRNKEDVTIEVLDDTVTSKGATLVITDKNDVPYGWGKSYKIQKKENEEWADLKPINEMAFEEIAYVLDENGQFKEELNFTRYYDELEDGVYRIVKDTYDKEYIYFYSNEFEIK